MIYVERNVEKIHLTVNKGKGEIVLPRYTVQ